MSRSNPTANAVHPAKKWIEWDGANGVLRYYDKEVNNPEHPDKKGANVTIRQPFTFLVLDETSAITGFHEQSKSNIVSNEVRDLRDQPLLVKSFKGGVIANGLYAAIKDRVVAAGGQFKDNVYIVCKNPETKELELCVLQLKGAAVSAWMDFRRKAGKAFYEQAVTVDGFTEGKKGAIKFRVPKFGLKEVSAETNAAALTMDKEVLQPHLSEYLKRGATVNTGAAAAQQPAGEEHDDHNDTQDPPDRKLANEEFNEGPITDGLEEDDSPV
jgi:hypothetical protein